MGSEKIRVAVIGAGTMGSGIAQVSAAAGHDTFIYDTQAAVLSSAEKKLQDTFDKLKSKGKMSQDEAEAAFRHIHFVNELSELKACGIAIEAIIENVAVKQKVFSELEKILGENAILASNTSSLSVTSIAGACKHPERVIGIHFFNPAPLMPLVEIIPGIMTSDETLSSALSIIKSWGKTTVKVKDTPGFIVNRVARPFYGESIRIFEERCYGLPEGEQGMATIDWAMKEIGGFRMGPFELMDLIGNDINYTVTETVWTQFFYDPRYKPSLTQKRIVEAGRLGRKSGRGYYDYREGAAKAEPLRDEKIGRKIFERVLAMLVNEAADALYLGIASREDLDLAMTSGVNYPKGLLKWSDEIGVEIIMGTLEDLRATYMEERYRPSVLLKKVSEGHRKFY